MNDERKPADRSVDERGEPVRLGEYNGFEVYPMPMFATLAAEDPSALAAWYEEALGFVSMFAGPVIHLRRAKYQDLLVVRAEPDRPAAVRGEHAQERVLDDDRHREEARQRVARRPLLAHEAGILLHVRDLQDAGSNRTQRMHQIFLCKSARSLGVSK